MICFTNFIILLRVLCTGKSESFIVVDCCCCGCCCWCLCELCELNCCLSSFSSKFLRFFSFSFFFSEDYRTVRYLPSSSKAKPTAPAEYRLCGLLHSAASAKFRRAARHHRGRRKPRRSTWRNRFLTFPPLAVCQHAAAQANAAAVVLLATLVVNMLVQRGK